MIISYRTLLYLVSLLGSSRADHGAFSSSSSLSSSQEEIDFVFPTPGKSYLLKDGDEIVLEWKPEITVPKMFLNCTSEKMQAREILSSMYYEFRDTRRG